MIKLDWFLGLLWTIFLCVLVYELPNRVNSIGLALSFVLWYVGFISIMVLSQKNAGWYEERGIEE